MILSVILFFILTNIDAIKTGSIWSFTFNGVHLGGETLPGKHISLIFFLNYLLLIPLVFIFKRMWFFFSSLSEGKIFTPQNFQALRFTGLLIAITGFLKSIVNYVTINGFFSNIPQRDKSLVLRLSFSDPWNFMVKTYNVGDYSIGFSLLSGIGMIFTGLLIMFFAHLFKQALGLKEENDLTI